jgi:hypothetical protein
MRAVTLGLTTLAVLVAAGLGAIQAADADSVTIAVLRGDGILIPIATRTGTRWSNTWPVPAKAADVPLGLDGIPKRWWGKGGPATTWHAWQIDGTTTDVVAERPSWYLAHCQQGVGLKTAITAQPPVPPPTVQPYPKLGLAATAPLAFRRIEPIDQRAPNWTPVVEAMTKAMSDAEAALGTGPAMNVQGRLKHPIPEAERARTPVHVESLYRMPLGRDRYLYYVEATKRYGMPPISAGRDARTPSVRTKDGCGVMSFAEGWFVAGADGTLPAPPKLDQLRVAPCDYDTVALMLPLGYVEDRKNPLWIAQLTGWENESYVVLQWDAGRGVPVIHYQTHGGWCQDSGGW